MGNGHSGYAQDMIKEWCERNGEPDYEYYYEHAFGFKGNGVLSTFNNGEIQNSPAVIDVNEKTYTQNCACEVYLVMKINPDLFTLNGYLIIDSKLEGRKTYNFIMTPGEFGLEMSGIKNREEIFGKLIGFGDPLLDFFDPGSHIQLFSALSFKPMSEISTDSGIIFVDPIFEDM